MNGILSKANGETRKEYAMGENDRFILIICSTPLQMLIQCLERPNTEPSFGV